MRAIIFLTSILYICYTTATVIKRLKNPEIDQNRIFSSRLKRSRGQADESFYSNLNSNKKSRVDQFITDTYYDEDCIKLFENLNYTEWVEPSVEELNKISLNFLDSESVEKYFEMIEQRCISKQIKSHNKESNYKDQYDFSIPHVTNFAENDIKNLSDEQSNENIKLDYFNCRKEVIFSSNENLKLNSKKSKSVCFEDFLNNFKSNIKLNYIKKIEHKSQINSYLERLKSLDEADSILYKYKLKQITLPTVFNASHDIYFIEKLRKLYSKFDKNSIFSRETCKKFFKDFFSLIYFNSTSINLRESFNRLIGDQKTLLFNFKVNKLHRYVGDIPELLIIGGLFSNRSFCNVAFIMHITILFIENIGNTKNDKNFILCMIYSMFYYYNTRFDMFKISYELRCQNDRHSLNCFTWEFDSSLRHNLLSRKKRGNKEKDLIHFKIILSTWIYQTFIFLKHSGHEIEDVIKLQEFCGIKLLFKGCIGCFYNDFISKVKLIIENNRL